MKKAAIYARVSTDEQINNTSLDGQVELCQRYAEYNNMEVVSIFREDFSGAYLEERPELTRLLNLVRNRNIDAVICKSSDRWSRDVSHTNSLKKILTRSGVELHYTNRGQSMNTPHGKFMDNMEGGFNQYWKDVLVDLMREGKNNKSKNGKPVMSGHAPYGYRTVGKGPDAHFVIYEPEARTVRDIFEWYVYGDGEGPLSLNAITKKLETRGDLTPSMKHDKETGDLIVAEKWWPATVRGILTNSIYTGLIYYGQTRVVEGERIKIDRNLWNEVPVPELAFIDVDIYKAAQERAKVNKLRAKRNRQRQYLLSGFFRCGYCGASMTGVFREMKGLHYYYYRCGNHWRKPGQRVCPTVNRSIPGSAPEYRVWSWVENLIKDDDALRDGIRKMIERSDEEVEPLRERLGYVEEFIRKAEKKLRRFMDQFADVDDEDVLETIQGEITRTAKEKASFEADRKKLLADLAQRSITPDQEEQLLKVAAELREELDYPDYETKRYIMNRLNLQVVYHENEERRWLVASCGLSADPAVIVLRPY
jgi:site-specific DNA recombinase